jgi:chromosome segregation ATPase
MATRDEIIRLLIETAGEDQIDSLNKALAQLEKDAAGGGTAAEKLAAELDKLATATKAAGDMVALKAAIADTEDRLSSARQKLADLNSTYDETERKTKSVAREFAAAEKAVSGLESDLNRQNLALQKMGGALAKAGVDVTALVSEEQRLRAEALKASEALKRQADAADKSAKENAELNREAERGSAIFSKLKGVLAGVAAAVAAAFSFTKVAGAIKDVFTQASAAEQATAQLEASLASTGNAAGLTAQELRAMADEMRSVTNFTDEQIQSAQTRLLSYTDIAKNEFPAALQIVLDQSARLGMSVEQSAEIVGRALQSPSKAMQSLSDQGFKFTAQQKEMLKSLEATGRMAEAQAVIMEMLAESYGGAALAQRVGMLSGAFKGLGDAVEDMQKRLVDQSLMNALRDEINATSGTLNELANSPQFAHLKDSFDYAFRAGLESVKNFREGASLPSLAAELGDVARTLGDVITIVNAIEERTQFFSDAWNGFRSTLVGGNNELVNLAQHGLHLVAMNLREVNEQLPETEGSANRAASGLGVLAAAAKAVQEGLAKLRAETFDVGISAGAAAVAQKLRDAADSAAAAKTEIAGLTAGIKDMSPAQIGDVAMGIAHVASESERAGKNVREGLVASLKSLSGQELLAFAQASQQAFDTFNTGAEKAAVVSETVLLTALERLGLKGAQLGVAITDSGRDIIATFETIASSAVATGEQIDAAFRAALNAASTTQEAAALKAALEAAFAAGRIGADQLAAGLQAVQTRMAAIKAEVDPLASAFDALGIKSQQALNAARDAAQVAFDRIVQGSRQGKAALSDTQAAFEAYARAELAAAQNSNAATRQQVENMLRLKGGAIGATDALERLGLVGAKAPEQVKPPADRSTASLHGLADAADRASGSIGGMGDIAENAGDQLDYLAGAAAQQAVSLGEMSREAADAYQAMNRFAGTDLWHKEMNRLTERITEQEEAFRSEEEQLKVSASQYENLGAHLARVRAEYSYLTAEQQFALAEARARAEAEGKTAGVFDAQAESIRDGNAALRERNALLEQQKQVTQVQEIKRTTEVNVNFTAKAARIEFDLSDLTDSQWRQVAAKVIEIIKRDMP